MTGRAIAVAGALACVLIVGQACQQPPREWALPDGTLGPDGDMGADGDGDGDADGDIETEADVEEAGPPLDLCDGVLCFPDETCDPETGECMREGLSCGEIVGCWYDAGIALTALVPCLLDGGAQGRRDFSALLTCLLTGCLFELLGAAQDPTPLGVCAFDRCPDELVPCAAGFF